MARTVDPDRHTARRLQIIDAALTCFAEGGYHGTSTAAICRAAGIGSGTLFHYFPTKQDVLLAILAYGTGETREWFEAQAGRGDPRAVLVEHVLHESKVLADPRLAGFVRVVGSVMGEPAVAEALDQDEASLYAHLKVWVAAAQKTGEIRCDVPAERLVGWLVLLLDGFTGRIASSSRFDAATERPLLLEQVDALLDGPTRVGPAERQGRDL